MIFQVFFLFKVIRILKNGGWIILKIHQEVVKIWIFVFQRKKFYWLRSSQPKLFSARHRRENSNVHNFLQDLHNNPSTSFRPLVTSANFHDFLPLPPYHWHSSKMLMRRFFYPYVLWPFDHRHMGTPLPP